MSEYARCWVNGLGKRYWQPQVGNYHKWRPVGFDWSWNNYGNNGQKPFLYRWRWCAIFTAKKAERRWARDSIKLCEGSE